jgi:hypothetical protein
LLQGQNIARKILPKSNRRTYVGYNDASQSVQYYNAESRKILTSWNYVFISAKTAEPEEEILVEDKPSLREGGEEEVNARNINKPSQTGQKRKRPENEIINGPRKTRGVR